MKTRWTRTCVASIAVVVVALLGAAPYARAAGLTAPAGSAQQLKDALERDGFTVQEGQVVLIDVLALCCHGLIPTCLGFNPIGPYKVVRLPNAPGQTTPSSFPWVFRLGANEAVVLIGQTPPPVTYFSYDSYVMTRYSDRESVRKVIFGNIGDAINNLTVRTREPDQGLFGQDVIIVFTADQSIDARIRGAAASVGYPAGMVNTGVIPVDIARLGLGANADEFAIVHRVALPQTGQEAALSAYLSTPQLALRVTLDAPVVSDPFPLPTLRVRGTGETEMTLAPALRDLRQAILDRYSGLRATELVAGVAPGQEYECLQKEINGYGPTRDSLYMRTDSTFKLPEGPDDFLIVYGVNHEASGKATYASLTVYEDSLMAAVAGDHSRRYAGSAANYLPDHPEAHLLYAWKIARDCQGDPHCLEVTMEGCPKIDLSELPALLLVWRLYQEAATGLGPTPGEILYDQAILFSSAGSTPALGPVTMDWQTCINETVGFAIRVPPTWRAEGLATEAEGTIHGMAFRGPEGGVEVRWGIIPSRDCTGEMMTVRTGKGDLSACYSRQSDGTEVWDQMRKPLTATIALCGRAYTNDATQASHDVLLRVLSMWSLPEATP